MTSVRPPTATYRLQLSKSFPFAKAAALAPYLADLGVSHAYLSPILKARPGSTHGYDVEDPTAINPELGGEKGFARMARRLRGAGLNVVLDIVPNHLCVEGGGNPWWNEVLEWGRQAPHARTFDIHWTRGSAAAPPQVVLPVLGDALDSVVEAGQLRVVWERGAFRLAYYGHRWPLTPASWPLILRPALARLEAGPSHPRRDVTALRAILRDLTTAPRAGRPLQDWAVISRSTRRAAKRISGLAASRGKGWGAISAELRAFNTKTGRARLAALLATQHYRLEWWRRAGETINYRRFFDINGLGGVRVEDAGVFRETHDAILKLVASGAVNGLRIDHPDGLHDPEGYFRTLHRAARREGNTAGSGAYVVVEKILGPDEALPSGWPVSGTTGYEALNVLNGVFVDTRTEAAFTRLNRRFRGDAQPVEAVAHDAKLLVLRTLFGGELRRLVKLAGGAMAAEGARRAISFDVLRAALEEMIACFPAYRTYLSARTPAPTAADRRVIGQAAAAARQHLTGAPAAAVRRISGLILKVSESSAARRARLDFVAAFQQLTAPVMAKGLEDTTFYRHVPLLSLNEVGGHPGQFGMTVAAFHRANEARQAQWPHGMTATSTHDTKRGEDARARLNVLSELPVEWGRAITRWRKVNRPHRSRIAGRLAPDANEEFLIYQSLVGAWPLGGTKSKEWPGFPARISAFVEKALREAKVHSSWHDPDVAYEAAVQAFVSAVLTPSRANRFIPEFERFLAPLVRAGLCNGLGQTLLKLAGPGVPDTYQGAEWWDFSLVDPDNRRPVDYSQRQLMLARSIREGRRDAAGLARRLMEDLPSGALKQWIVHRVLTHRRGHPGLYAQGRYVPLSITGGKARHAVAFARIAPGEAVVAVAGRFFSRMADSGSAPGTWPWGRTALAAAPALPAGAYRDVLTNTPFTLSRGGATLLLRDLFRHLPVALLEWQS